MTEMVNRTTEIAMHEMVIFDSLQEDAFIKLPL